MMQDTPKIDKSALPSVAIDGARIRTVREGKKLTQLYVANVVGVTTDTISRWENNRYPSIKRDNAEKLAGALEVTLEEILRQDEPEPDPEVAEGPDTSKPRRWTLLLLALIPVLALLIFVASRLLVGAPKALRWAPHFAAPGEVVPVQIKITRTAEESNGFILKEHLPSGWHLVSAQPGNAAVDHDGSIVKWLVPAGQGPVTVSYTVQLPANLPSGKSGTLRGEVVLHEGETNRTEPVAGSTGIQVGAYHWADSNGDGRIDDDEIMPAYYLCEDMKGIGLDWKTIEAIWSGKGYRWDAKGGFQVLK
ncbi:transcriptional regulator [Geomonas limicola]|uniref:Transcriptional regulator n=1 Tax=Geomonas limicola TaxID=2740186 RepID=A0A6V8N4U7_9BACT|nr:helix-turn-helix transcriptional regulator [Geomonas limicola]GFO67575.1 transcriptional regulator [Geomonas limicola]